MRSITWSENSLPSAKPTRNGVPSGADDVEPGELGLLAAVLGEAGAFDRRLSGGTTTWPVPL